MYPVYYILKTPGKTFFRYFDYVKKQKGVSSFNLYKDIVVSSVKYNISFMDYFQLRFFNLTPNKREAYAGTGFMYEYQLKMNPPNRRSILDDKIEFLKHFESVSGRKWGTVEMIRKDMVLAKNIIQTEPFKIVLKKSKGKAGKGVLVLDSRDLSVEEAVLFMEKNGYNLIEKYVIQHDRLMALSPSALNTVRIITQLQDGKAIIIAARLRVSVNSNVDNLTAGNFAAPVDACSGIVNGPGVYGDIAKPDVFYHPVTGTKIEGFLIPHWEECIEMVTKAALSVPDNRSIGWDVAVTNERPILIEGNHDWGRVLWQLPVKKGLKEELLQYL